MHTVALIAKQHLEEGTELLMDYRLDPEVIANAPSWYHPLDMEIIKRNREHFKPADKEKSAAPGEDTPSG